MNKKEITILIVLWLIAFSNLYAQDWIFKTSLGTTYIVTYLEEDYYYLDQYFAPIGKLQERVKHLTFSSEEKLNNYLHEHYNQFFDKQVWNYFAMNDLLSIFNVSTSGLSVEDIGSTNHIWENKNTWDEEWETEYARWIEKNVDKDFLKNHKISVDCADVAYALRWIFSRINYLPAANTLAGSGDLFTNESFKDEWKDLKTSSDWHNDERFLKALDYLLDNTYTHTLHNDIYPIKISRAIFISGVIHLSLFENNGHTRVLTKTNYEDSDQIPIMLMSGTTPRMLRTLYEETFLWSHPLLKNQVDWFK
ncbi:MAG: hypothetical protein A2381_15620 [Bdellovibrionales bacterium RIFOXYB1_FULL_37_110]|nr:MAG: hypothetical protein A2417_07470 [Bdellovibrionales bacterium RIFOXYC1_FULL_37_79]OFZ57050.1 MAG: hypothetical protein A2381_15620 [Bdellovibrionales bacterium RIFOXYB1_FULL_37_110]OFZ64896.1 MAG: hypothetical protein A2577_16980 [Bdellovibrionales bacterium RIFOXYD1_FULL_36_51]